MEFRHKLINVEKTYYLVHENICFGRKSRNLKEEEVWKVAKNYEFGAVQKLETQAEAVQRCANI